MRVSNKSWLELKKNLKYIRNAAVVVLLLIFACCSSYDVRGMVYDLDGRPVRNYKLELQPFKTSTTDIVGRFYFSDVRKGTYTISGGREGYEAVSSAIEVFSDGQVVYLKTPSLANLLKLTHTSLVENRLEEAEGYINRALAIKPHSAEMYYYAAVLMFRQGKHAEASAFLEESGKIAPNSPAIRTFMAALQGMETEE